MSGKPTFYLWESSDTPADIIERKKKQLLTYGFRVTVLKNGPIGKEINQGIKAFINNHINAVECVRGESNS